MRSRLDAAARRLRAGDDPIPTLADDCGFPNLSNFYRLFRRRFHCTPARWRAGRGGEFA
jgi:AraC-like DNA-binding protein